MPLGRVLVIAGSDNSGGAGLEADQKVIAAHGCYAMTATTALTAQNTTGVFGIHQIPPEFLKKQIDASFDDIGVDVVKTGMLASAAAIEVVANALEQHKVKSVVIDPVMIATTGAQLLPPEALRVLREGVLPRATIVTPNIPEARLLLADAGYGHLPLNTVDDLEVIAKSIQSLGSEWALVKGGHQPFKSDHSVANSSEESKIVVDVLFGQGKAIRIERPYQDSRNTHGTGCSLASAIASNLAKGLDVTQAVKTACRYIEAGIKLAPGLGKGNGPLNHFHSTYTLPFAPGYFLEYLLERPDIAPIWDRFVNHPFVLAMGDGTLPIKSFQGYMIQDYLYLIQFARANALAGYKSKTMEDIAAAAAIVTHINTEMALHIKYCESFGISLDEMKASEEKEACTAYTRFVLDVGQSGDWMGLQLALAPCLLGYGVVGQQLFKDSRSVRGEENKYWKWITNYVADDYVTAVKRGSDLLERNIVNQSPARIEELVKIFAHATKMEIAFWEMFPSK